MADSDARDGSEPDELDEADELGRLREENQKLRSRMSRRKNVRQKISVVLVFLSILLVIASTVAVWTYRTALNSDRFVDAVEPALEEPALYEAVSEVVYTQALVALDLETRVEARLAQADEYISEALTEALDVDTQGRQLLSRFDRPSLEALTPAITSALEDRVRRIVDRLITSEQFRQRLPELIRQGHEAAVALLRGDTEQLPNVYAADGEVRLNLVPLITDVVRQVVNEFGDLLPDIELPDAVSTAVTAGRQQLADALGEQLSDDFGQVTLMSEEALGEAQAGLDRLDRYMWVILLVTFAVLAITIAVAPSRRRVVLQLGVGIIVGMLLGAVVVRRLRRLVLGEIESPHGERAAAALLDQTIGSLRTTALIVGAVALLAGVAAHLAGRPQWARRASERGAQLTARTPAGSDLDRWISSHYDLVRFGGLLLAVAVVFLVGIDVVPLIVVGALLALYLWALSVAKNRVPAEPALINGRGQ